MFYIITKNSVPGYHHWKDAPERLAFLRSRHRHIFEISLKIPVGNADRDKEIIETQNAVQEYLLGAHGIGTKPLEIDIGDMSCESLAKELADAFGAQEVTVLEDGYGGACYVRAGEEC